MSISATVVADSVSEAGIRLTTLQVTMHRFVLAEFNTHRVFSRNFRSSRAVPVKKLLEEVRESPAIPVEWLSNQKGMQGGEELVGDNRKYVETVWRAAARSAASYAELMAKAGLHKSWANRVIEPFLYVHGVVTATEWDNFFELRDHPDAQPEIRALARAMRTAIDNSMPRFLLTGKAWHTPYINDGITLKDRGGLWKDCIKCSVARCARVSYKTHDDRFPNLQEDLDLYDRLMCSAPEHASPAEHQATPGTGWMTGNFRGWLQFRHNKGDI